MHMNRIRISEHLLKINFRLTKFSVFKVVKVLEKVNFIGIQIL